MIRAKDAVVLVALAWWLLRDREETNVGLFQYCADIEGNLHRVPLGDCPPGTTLVTGETPPIFEPIGDPEQQLGGCGCGTCAECS